MVWRLCKFNSTTIVFATEIICSSFSLRHQQQQCFYWNSTYVVAFRTWEAREEKKWKKYLKNPSFWKTRRKSSMTLIFNGSQKIILTCAWCDQGTKMLECVRLWALRISLHNGDYANKGIVNNALTFAFCLHLWQHRRHEPRSWERLW